MRPAPCWVCSTTGVPAPEPFFLLDWARVCESHLNKKRLTQKINRQTIYGLSLIASLLCASATRRLASATLRTRSSEMAGVPALDTVEDVAGVGPLEMTAGEGVEL